MARILIIEDDQNQAETMQNLLAGKNHVAWSITSPNADALGTELIEWLKANVEPMQPLDFLILDIDFPNDKLGGLTVYEKILEHGLRRRFKHLLIVSQYVDYDTRPEHQALVGFHLGCLVPWKNFLKKLSHRPDDLIARINELLSPANDPVITVAEKW